MATIYVSKSGSNLNSGATAALAMLTIQAGITAAGSGGTVIVGSGWYNELLFMNTSCLLYADGNVILDGQGLNGALITCANATLAYTIQFLPYTTGGNFTFQNSGSTMIVNIYSGTGGNTATPTFNRCTFKNSGNIYGIYYYISNINWNSNPLVVQNCIFSGFSTAILFSIGTLQGAVGSANVTLINNTFHNNMTALSIPVQGTANPRLALGSGNIFSGCTTALSGVLTPLVLNNNLYYICTNLLNVNGVLYTTLSSVQALGFDLNSAAPVGSASFTDSANNIFFLTQQQPLFPNVAQVGAYPYGYTQGANNNSTGTWNIIAGAGHDNSGWYNPDGNVTKDGTTGNLILSNMTSGVIWSPVIDTGIIGCKTTELDISGIQVYPTNMIDSTLADVRPNYQTSEVRASDTIFTQNDGVLAWTTIKNNIPFTAISGRYIQCRITLTTLDGQG